MICHARVAGQLTHSEVYDLLESIVSTDTKELGIYDAFRTAYKAQKLKGQGSRQKISTVGNPEPKTMV